MLFSKWMQKVDSNFRLWIDNVDLKFFFLESSFQLAHSCSYSVIIKVTPGKISEYSLSHV